MDEKTLIAFIERIIHNCGGDSLKLRYSMEQLETILKEQNSPTQILDIITKAVGSVPELSDYSKKPEITAKDLREADSRAILRRQREEALRREGRC